MTQLRDSTAGDVLARALHLRDDWRYDEVAGLCDPESAEAFFRRHLEACEPPTIDEVLEEYPDVGLDTAKVFAARFAQYCDDQKHALVRSLRGVSSFDEVVALGPRDFLSRWLESMDARYDLLRRVRAAGRPVPDWMLHGVPGMRYEITGQEKVDESTVRVSYRDAVDSDRGTNYGSERSEHVRRLPNGEWRLVVRSLLLHPGEVAHEVPPEFADLYLDELPPR